VAHRGRAQLLDLAVQQPPTTHRTAAPTRDLDSYSIYPRRDPAGPPWARVPKPLSYGSCQRLSCLVTTRCARPQEIQLDGSH